jgi:tRNA A37 threonylcarbamoyladenosine modification protein TsaB
MREHLQGFSLLINPISSPVQIAIYKDGKLFKSFEKEGFVSDFLIDLLEEITKEYKLNEIIYVNGPGSYMGVKLTFVALKTLEIVKDIPFFGTLGFELNGNKPIKAMGKLYFIKEKENIITKKIDEVIKESFFVPVSWNQIKKTKTNEPLYHIPSVG